MDNIDLMVLRTLRDWCAEGRKTLLATVIRTWGSSPRPVGAMMALREDGRAVGSVSGGCIEDDLIYRYTTANGGPGIPATPTAIVRYGVTADEAHQFGLPCGGTLELALEFAPALDSLVNLVNRLEGGELVRRVLALPNGSVRLEPSATALPLEHGDSFVANTLGPSYRILLIGAGALSEYVATMALFNGFSVVVCDPRQEFLDTWSVTGATRLSMMPDDAVAAFRPDQRSFIVALTHDPRLDDLALLQALDSPALYVGAIGSRRNNNARHERLSQHFGITPETLERLHGPIGLYIGSKTPAEIAVSIVAELLAIKNGVSVPPEMKVSEAKSRNETATRPRII